ncbi:hypothetical protein [Dyadobacter psychrotolerans]|uniref:Uncharacterized protein n=1 Tax=Dyadobacter psychrotolerans TaxID=2541721 RepID=A0A4R5DLR2_9BACT|nr:hypothetical protein [Dyadobacter psychrotolerans]TDE15192.1 hypothetical protein E0F88_11750 [Dyadobacter psychrotolerans]
MQIHKRYLISLFLFLMLLACKDNQKQQQLMQREQALTEREKEFAMKEADYYALLRMRDSLLTKKDTIFIQQWPQSIAGFWNAKSVCRESDCSDYVIGDQRSNVWEFVSDSTGLHTRVTDKNNNLVRIYKAHYDTTGINLQFVSDSSARKKINLSIDLTTVLPELIKGVQTSKSDQTCTAKFSIELTRSTSR